MNYADYFVISTDSPSRLKWKVNKGRARAGDNAITAIGGGYYKGRLNQKTVYAHRIVFALTHGYEPEVVDHEDGNPLNNDPLNLRDGTKALNNQNRVSLGCYYNKRDRVFYSSICLNGKRHHLGTYKTKEEAARAYMDAKSIFHEFANMERYSDVNLGRFDASTKKSD